MTGSRLPDWAYNEVELVEHMLQVVSDIEPKGDMLLVKIHGPNGDTGKCMILHGSRELAEIVDRVWARTKLILIVDKVRPDVQYTDYIGFINLIRKFKFNTKFPDMPYADSVYTYKSWMGEII